MGRSPFNRSGHHIPCLEDRWPYQGVVFVFYEDGTPTDVVDMGTGLRSHCNVLGRWCCSQRLHGPMTPFSPKLMLLD